MDIHLPSVAACGLLSFIYKSFLLTFYVLINIPSVATLLYIYYYIVYIHKSTYIYIDKYIDLM